MKPSVSFMSIRQMHKLILQFVYLFLIGGVLLMTGCRARERLIRIQNLEIVSQGITSNRSIRIDFRLSDFSQAVAYKMQHNDQGRVDVLLYRAFDADDCVHLDDEGRFSIELDSVLDLHPNVDLWLNRTHHLGGWSLK